MARIVLAALMALLLMAAPATAEEPKTPQECRSWCASVGCAHEAECVGECLRGNLNVRCGGDTGTPVSDDADTLTDKLFEEVDEVWTTTCSLKCLKCPFDKVTLCENQCQSKCSPHCCGCAKNVKGTSDCPLGACAFCPGVTDGDGKTACEKLAEEAEAEAEAEAGAGRKLFLEVQALRRRISIMRPRVRGRTWRALRMKTAGNGGRTGETGLGC